MRKKWLLETFKIVAHKVNEMYDEKKYVQKRQNLENVIGKYQMVKKWPEVHL